MIGALCLVAPTPSLCRPLETVSKVLMRSRNWDYAYQELKRERYYFVVYDLLRSIATEEDKEFHLLFEFPSHIGKATCIQALHRGFSVNLVEQNNLGCQKQSD